MQQHSTRELTRAAAIGAFAALVGLTLPAEAGTDATDPDSSKQEVDGRLETVIVTAEKRAERLQDVPIPETVVDTGQLVDTNQPLLSDYFSQIPGLNFQPGLLGATLAIRGLVTGGEANPTVGIVIDDVPYGPTVNPGESPFAPDLDPGDLARIEVLRGPQGTLYGASSLGGLVKYVTVDPSTDAISGRLQVGTSGVNYGADPGYTARGSVNVPLSSDLAVRTSAFSRLDPGYVDNIESGQRDVNKTEAYGAHVSALWRPADNFSAKLSALYQDVDRRGPDLVDSSLGSNFQQRLLIGTGGNDHATQAYSATLNVEVGGIDWVSITGYSVDRSYFDMDGGGFYDSLAVRYGVEGSSVITPAVTDKFSQEIRATMPIGERIRWLLGAFFTREKFGTTYSAFANDTSNGAPVATFLTATEPASYEEYAAFTNIEIEMTSKFDIQLGGRLSKNEQSFSTDRYGPLSTRFYGSDPSDIPEVRSSGHSFTYLVTPRLEISSDLMVYARLASGYRPGGANANCSSTFPCTYEADTTENYELGIKGTLLDHVLSFDGSVYYIPWKDMQIQLYDAAQNVVYTANAAQARSLGVEASVEAKPLRGLTVAGWVAWNSAELTRALPATAGYGTSGSKLPFSSPFTANLSLDQEFPLGNRVTGSVGGSASYVGGRGGVFQASTDTPRATFPGYSRVDLRAGLHFADWRINAYSENVADKRGVLQSGLSDTGVSPTGVIYIRPRTVGLSVTRIF